MREILVFLKISESTPENWYDDNPVQYVSKRTYKNDPSPPKLGQIFEGLTIFGPTKNHIYHLKKGYTLSYSILKNYSSQVLVEGNPSAYTDEANV